MIMFSFSSLPRSYGFYRGLFVGAVLLVDVHLNVPDFDAPIDFFAVLSTDYIQPLDHRTLTLIPSLLPIDLMEAGMVMSLDAFDVVYLR